MTAHLLTSSRLRSFQSCPRAHHYRYEVGLAPIAPETGARALGTATHAGLEAWWLAHMEDAPQYALPAAMEAAQQSFPVDDPFALAMLRALVTGYDARWAEWARTVEVLGVERAFEIPLRNPVTGASASTWRVAGKIDALARLSDGRVAIIEHKTRSGDAGAGSDYRRKLTLDPQISTYFDGAAALGYVADLCLYDVLVKPAIKPLLATPEESRRIKKDGTPYAGVRFSDETAVEYEARLLASIAADPERYLIHAEIVRSDAEREAHAWALWHSARAIEETRRAARAARDVRAVPQSPGSCFGTGHRCDFLEVCEGTADARDTSRFRRLPTVHPELMPVQTAHTAHDNAAE